MNNRVQFKHFYGTKTEWLSKINNSNDWNDSVVFGQVKNEETGKWEYIIYAGKVVTDSSTIYYIYNISDVSGGIGPSNVHIDVSTCEPNVYYIGQTPAHGDYYIKEEYLSYINSDSGKNTLPDDPSAVINTNVAPRRTAYIFDATLRNGAGNWVALDGNVNAENVYFPEGFLRTQKWGVAAAKEDTKSDDEIIGKNLKEVFEYYLVEEIFKGDVSNAKLTTPEWFINGTGDASLPKDLYKYVQLNDTTMSSNSSLVKVGTTITINTIDVSASPSHTGPAEITGEPPKIFKMFKYANASRGPIVNADTCIGVTPYIHFDYTTNFNTTNATLLLISNNQNIISSSSNTGRINSSVIIGQSSSTLSEGKLTLTLKYSNDVTASRVIDSSVKADSISVYPVSNKDNISTGRLTASGKTPSDNHKTATNKIKKSDTTVTINAVYPIFTNGTMNADQTNGMNDRNTNCLWSDNNTYHGQLADSSKYTEWPLIDFNSPKTIYVNVNDFGPDHPNDKPIIFIPSNLQLKIETHDLYLADGKKKIPAAGFDGTGKINVYETGGLKFDDPTIVILDGTNYDMYKIADDCFSGQTSLQLDLIKK